MRAAHDDRTHRADWLMAAAIMRPFFVWVRYLILFALETPHTFAPEAAGLRQALLPHSPGSRAEGRRLHQSTGIGILQSWSSCYLRSA